MEVLCLFPSWDFTSVLIQWMNKPSVRAHFSRTVQSDPLMEDTGPRLQFTQFQGAPGQRPEARRADSITFWLELFFPSSAAFLGRVAIGSCV